MGTKRTERKRKEKERESSKVFGGPDSVKVLEGVRDVKSLKDKREGRVIAANTGDGSLKEEEGSLLDSGSDLSGKTTCLWGLVTDHTATGLLDRFDDGFDIPG